MFSINGESHKVTTNEYDELINALKKLGSETVSPSQVIDWIKSKDVNIDVSELKEMTGILEKVNSKPEKFYRKVCFKHNY